MIAVKNPVFELWPFFDSCLRSVPEPTNSHMAETFRVLQFPWGKCQELFSQYKCNQTAKCFKFDTLASDR